MTTKQLLKNRRNKQVTSSSAKETLSWSVRGYGMLPSHIRDIHFGGLGSVTRMWLPVCAVVR